MNREIFKRNLKKSLLELSEYKGIPLANDYKFSVKPIFEKEKKHTSKDDAMRLNIFSPKNLDGRLINEDILVRMFSSLEPLYPIWIHVSAGEIENEIKIIDISTSLRFRKPSLLQNKETGHEPFRVINI